MEGIYFIFGLGVQASGTMHCGGSGESRLCGFGDRDEEQLS